VFGRVRYKNIFIEGKEYIHIINAIYLLILLLFIKIKNFNNRTFFFKLSESANGYSFLKEIQ